MLHATIYRINDEAPVATATLSRGRIVVAADDEALRRQLMLVLAMPALRQERDVMGVLRDVLLPDEGPEHFRSQCMRLFTLGLRAVVEDRT